MPQLLSIAPNTSEHLRIPPFNFLCFNVEESGPVTVHTEAATFHMEIVAAHIEATIAHIEDAQPT